MVLLFGNSLCRFISAHESINAGITESLWCGSHFRKSHKSLPRPLRIPTEFGLDLVTDHPTERKSQSLRCALNERRGYKNISIYLTELPPTPEKYSIEWGGKTFATDRQVREHVRDARTLATDHRGRQHVRDARTLATDNRRRQHVREVRVQSSAPTATGPDVSKPLEVSPQRTTAKT